MSAAGTAAACTIVLPGVVALIGLPLARRHPVWGREWAVLGAAATLAAAAVEAWAVYTGHPVGRIPFLGTLDIGNGRITLDLQADALTATRRRGRRLRRPRRPGLLDGLPRRCPRRSPGRAGPDPVPRLRRDRFAVHGGDDDRRPCRRPRPPARRLGGHGRLLLPAHRAPQRAAGGARRRRQGIPRHQGRRSRGAGRRRPAAGRGPDDGDPGAARRRARPAARGRARRRAAAPRRRGGQVRAVPPAHLAAGRDGGPDAGVGADPRRHDGGGRRLPRGAAAAALPRRPGRARRGGRDRRGDHARGGAGRGRPGGPQAAARLVDGQPGRVHARRRGHGPDRGRGRSGRLPPAHPCRVQGPAVPPRRMHRAARRVDDAA